MGHQAPAAAGACGPSYRTRAALKVFSISPVWQGPFTTFKKINLFLRALIYIKYVTCGLGIYCNCKIRKRKTAYIKNFTN